MMLHCLWKPFSIQGKMYAVCYLHALILLRMCMPSPQNEKTTGKKICLMHFSCNSMIVFVLYLHFCCLLGCRFYINPTSGTIYLIGPLDFEAQSEHSFLVFASDNADLQRTQGVLVRIKVIDVNDVGPQFTLSSYTAVVSEGSTTFESPVTVNVSASFVSLICFYNFALLWEFICVCLLFCLSLSFQYNISMQNNQ